MFNFGIMTYIKPYGWAIVIFILGAVALMSFVCRDK